MVNPSFIKRKKGFSCLNANKKMIFLSNQVFSLIRERKVVCGTELAVTLMNEYKKKGVNVEFKNIQRRVYDAINVLTALNFIEKKSHGEVVYKMQKQMPNLEQEKKVKKRIADKTKQLFESLSLYNNLQCLFQANRKRIKEIPEEQKVRFPFVLLNLNSSAKAQIRLNGKKNNGAIFCDSPPSLTNEGQLLNNLMMKRIITLETKQSSPRLVAADPPKLNSPPLVPLKKEIGQNSPPSSPENETATRSRKTSFNSSIRPHASSAFSLTSPDPTFEKRSRLGSIGLGSTNSSQSSVDEENEGKKKLEDIINSYAQYAKKSLNAIVSDCASPKVLATQCSPKLGAVKVIAGSADFQAITPLNQHSEG
eukprot:TRINITY_DN565_c0_g1_i3.p1 TRINITY_DN565_c0_g1~~TRINITY_DN565_c0_g1_i3.p1  ORF type:complete len:365 (-),score=14.34 TRINITY_DN565_c0_g1_i3:41-1135(-)